MVNPPTDTRSAVDGVLLLDKPSGPTSNRILQIVKRLYAARKAGHAGTLDPLATGVLPILFGEATKFAAFLSDACKVYEATIRLGLRTATGDLEGDVLDQCPVDVSLQAVELAAARFQGVITQIPPMYSAIKQGGRPLYELARRGETVVRQPREVRVHEFNVLALRGSEVDVRVRCSKGTYVRVLAEDLGQALGCGATLSGLRRIEVGPFRIASAYTLDVLEEATDAARQELLLPVDAGLGHVPALRIGADIAARFRVGQTVRIEAAETLIGMVRLYEIEKRRFLGLGQCDRGSIRPTRLVSEFHSAPGYGVVRSK